jgi:hypothetical protein
MFEFLLYTFLCLSCFEHKISSKPQIDLRNEFIYLSFFGLVMKYHVPTPPPQKKKYRKLRIIVRNACCIRFCLFMQMIALSTNKTIHSVSFSNYKSIPVREMYVIKLYLFYDSFLRYILLRLTHEDPG